MAVINQNAIGHTVSSDGLQPWQTGSLHSASSLGEMRSDETRRHERYQCSSLWPGKCTFSSLIRKNLHVSSKVHLISVFDSCSVCQ